MNKMVKFFAILVSTIMGLSLAASGTVMPKAKAGTANKTSKYMSQVKMSNKGTNITLIPMEERVVSGSSPATSNIGSEVAENIVPSKVTVASIASNNVESINVPAAEVASNVPVVSTPIVSTPAVSITVAPEVLAESTPNVAPTTVATTNPNAAKIVQIKADKDAKRAAIAALASNQVDEPITANIIVTTPTNTLAPQVDEPMNANTNIIVPTPTNPLAPQVDEQVTDNIVVPTPQPQVDEPSNVTIITPTPHADDSASPDITVVAPTDNIADIKVGKITLPVGSISPASKISLGGIKAHGTTIVADPRLTAPTASTGKISSIVSSGMKVPAVTSSSGMVAAGKTIIPMGSKSNGSGMVATKIPSDMIHSNTNTTKVVKGDAIKIAGNHVSLPAANTNGSIGTVLKDPIENKASYSSSTHVGAGHFVGSLQNSSGDTRPVAGGDTSTPLTAPATNIGAHKAVATQPDNGNNHHHGNGSNADGSGQKASSALATKAADQMTSRLQSEVTNSNASGMVAVNNNIGRNTKSHETTLTRVENRNAIRETKDTSNHETRIAENRTVSPADIKTSAGVNTKSDSRPVIAGKLNSQIITSDKPSDSRPVKIAKEIKTTAEIKELKGNNLPTRPIPIPQPKPTI